jgi:hypothetical protein
MNGYESEPRHMEVYTYSRFDLERPGIRLLRLCMGTGPTIECELFQAWLDGEADDLMPYEALSYTWGGTEMSKSVHIGNRALSVTENLYSALYHLRSIDEDRILWVDAVCIDQSDLRERGHQVAQMGQIYSRADRVIIWLGASTEEVDILLDCLKQLERLGTKEWHISDPHWKEAWAKLQSKFEIRYLQCVYTQRTGLQSLLNQPWFRRVWIIQEVAHAKRAIICSGHKFIMAHTFAVATNLMEVQIEDHCKAILEIMPGRIREKTWWGANRDLRTVLEKFRHSEASDPRDNIYALLGICADSQDPGCPRADYMKDIEHLVHDTAMFVFGCPDYLEDFTLANLLKRVRDWNSESLDRLVRRRNQACVSKHIQDMKIAPQITTELICLAASNPDWGEEVMRYLLQFECSKVGFTKDVISSVVRNTRSSNDLIRVLCTECPGKILISAANCGSEIMKRFLETLGSKLKFTGDILVAFVRCGPPLQKQDWDCLFQKFDFKATIPEEAILDIAWRYDVDQYFWTKLIKQFGSRMIITDRVINTLITRLGGGLEILVYLVEQRGREISLTHDADIALWHLAQRVDHKDYRYVDQLVDRKDYRYVNHLSILAAFCENERIRISQSKETQIDKQRPIFDFGTVAIFSATRYEDGMIHLSKIVCDHVVAVQVTTETFLDVKYTIRALARRYGKGLSRKRTTQDHENNTFADTPLDEITLHGEEWCLCFDPQWDPSLSKEIDPSLDALWEKKINYAIPGWFEYDGQDLYCRYVKIWKFVLLHYKPNS